MDEITHEKDMWKEKFEAERVSEAVSEKNELYFNKDIHVDQQ